MDFRGLSSDVRKVLKEGSFLGSKNNSGAYPYDLAILFARIWFLKAEIFVHSKTLTTSVEDFFESLHEGSRFLLKSFGGQLKEKAEIQTLKLIEGMPGQVESLYKSSQSEALVENHQIRDLLYRFLVQLKLFKADALLSGEILNQKEEVSPLKKQIGTLQEGLAYLIKSDVNHPRKKEYSEDEKLILADIERLAAGVSFLCDSCPADSMELQLSNLQGKVQGLKLKLTDLYFQNPSSNFPKMPGLAPIKSLLQKLQQLRKLAHESVECATYQIEAIHGELELIICNYGHSLENEKSADDIRARLVNAAYEVQHVIDLMVSGSGGESQQLLWLFHLSEEIIHVKNQLRDCFKNRNKGLHPSELITHAEDKTASHGLKPIVSKHATHSAEKIMVGFDSDKAFILNELIHGGSHLDVVSIVGMGGIGKTTLAKNVFESLKIVHHFHTRVWCCVSQTYVKKRDLLLGVLRQLLEFTDNTLEMEDQFIEELLHKFLKGKRYLIVMDDVWHHSAWADLRNSLPDDLCGSRILITSRFLEFPKPHHLHLLSDDESWELLKKKVFGYRWWPEEFLKFGQQIAKTCKGLPLAINTVSGLLGATDEDKWQEIAERLSITKAMSATEHVMTALELSYQHLPDNLKECFLYFVVCAEDEDFSVRKLLWLWIAEGFITDEKSRTLEDLAKECFMQLIGTNLIMVAKKKSNGEVKRCRVHDLVLDFCKRKAKEANFMQLISGEPSSVLHDEHYNPSASSNSEQYRLSISGDPEGFIVSKPSGPFVRSLLFFTANQMYPGCHSDVSFIFSNFKLLKVLDLEFINAGNTLEVGLDLPVHLRYFAVGGDMDSIPSSLFKLQNLETLVVTGLMNKFVLPDTIWSMAKLRHLRITNHCIFTLQYNKNRSYSKLDSLVSLTMPSFICGEETNNIVTRFPHIRKLKCKVLEPLVGSMLVPQFPALGSLHQLETLVITYYGRPLKTCEFNLPSSLKKLTLSNFRLQWIHISDIGRLPKLEILKLISGAFVGSRWNMEEGEFLNLKYLKLDSLDIVQWDAPRDILPCLEQLVLRNCKQLGEVPVGFADISTLQKIEVHQCGVSVEESVRRIVEQQLEFGNEDIISVFP
ncbi:OLC1v1031977C1 [Oldenlandia corymbosa var. corymbosa]|uniref:OLC1v1031977C1 n=1 Tax=Oldenlandia corymbosa var. corymbosa TaxID=529605 RepID=A0AAV1CK57_OLDCO|nr:OLC1v1031977C1 [Oldenlandia corymbosa var. corymbosa]